MRNAFSVTVVNSLLTTREFVSCMRINLIVYYRFKNDCAIVRLLNSYLRKLIQTREREMEDL